MTRSLSILAILGLLLGSTSLFGSPGDLARGGSREALAAPLQVPDDSIVFNLMAQGLSTPTTVTSPLDGTGRLFIVERRGVIKIFKNGQINPTPFLDIQHLVLDNGEQGLLGLAFHPNYKNNGRFFVYYTAKRAPGAVCPGDCGDNTVAEFQVSGNPDVANSPIVRTLFALTDRREWHNGGSLGFSPVDANAYLYIGTGDEGVSGDIAQDLNSLFGKILRIDVDNIPSGQGYGIPPTNPFVGQSGVRPEIWAYGFRNPWRFSFDRQTGDLFIGDVGESNWEEIDLIPSLLVGTAGRNFGWNVREGRHCFPHGTPTCDSTGMVDPIIEYDQSVSTHCAVTGGILYRGNVNPNLKGLYIFSDACSGVVWKAVKSGQTWNAIEAVNGPFGVISFFEDDAGEIYGVTLAGGLYRITQSATQPVANCSQRPRVEVQTVRTGPGQLTVTVRATTSTTAWTNQLQTIAFERITNGTVSIGAQANQTSPFGVNLPANAQVTQFTIQRQQAGAPVHVDFTVTDACGPWRSFAGGGATMP